jgi:hypothetical protein
VDAEQGEVGRLVQVEADMNVLLTEVDHVRDAISAPLVTPCLRPFLLGGT